MVIILFSLNHAYVIGTQAEVDIKVVIENFGEDAFEAFVEIEFPDGVEYINVDSSNSVSTLHVQMSMILLGYQFNLVYLLRKLTIERTSSLV